MKRILMLAVLPFLMCGCRSTKYIPVETVRTEFRERTNTEYVIDSISNDRLVYIAGDTVYVTQTRDRWKIRTVLDSVFIHKTDTIRMPYPVEKTVEVERRAAWWEVTLMVTGGFFLILLGYAAYRKVKMT